MIIRKKITSMIMTMAMVIALLTGIAPQMALAADPLLQIGSLNYETWAAAVSAVKAGETITLLNNVTLSETDTMPAVACTIDGGNSKYTLTLYSDTRMKADTAFKDITFGGEKILYCYDTGTEYSSNITIEGTVSGSVRIRCGKSITVNGTLDCLDVTSFERLTVNTGASLSVYDYIIAKYAEINGTAKVNRYHFTLEGSESSKGILSGNGTIVFTTKNSYGCNLHFSNAYVDASCRITLSASYSPVDGDKLIDNIQSASPITNIDRLKLGGNYSAFKLNGTASGSSYCYSLAASAAKSALTQTSITLAPGNTNGGLTYTISNPISGEASGISCYCIKLYNSAGTVQVGDTIYFSSTTGKIPSSLQMPGGSAYTAKVQALAKITSDYLDSTESELCAAATSTKSESKAITSFKIGAVTGAVNADYTITAVMPYGTALSALSPTITVSDMASVSHASGVTTDFSNSATNPVTYTVTAENGNKQEYKVTVTKTEDPCLQIGSVKYGTWTQAAGAVQAGETITLLEDVTMLSGDVMPAVTCSIDGGSALHTLTLNGGQSLQADIILKNLKLYSDDSGDVYVNCKKHNLNIIGTVSATNISIANGAELNVEGTLEIAESDISMFEKLTVRSGSSLIVFSAGEIENAEINGTVTCKYFSLSKENGEGSGSSGSGMLSGNGTIKFTKDGGEGPNLLFNNVKIDSNTLIKLDAKGYTPKAGQYLVGNKRFGETGSATPLDNINCLVLGSGYSGFKLVGDSSYKSEYDYVLEASASTDSGYTGGDGSTTGTAPVTTTTSGSGSNAVTIAGTVVSGTTSNGKQTVPIPTDTMTSLTDAAKKAESSGGKTAARIDTGSGTGLSNVGVTIPSAQFNAFASGTGAELQIKSGLGSVTFSSKAVDTIGAAGSGDVTFAIATVDKISLSADEQKLVGTRPVYSFSVTVGNTKVSEFGSSVTVSVPYKLDANEDPNAIVVYYIDASGKLQPMQGKYDSKTGTVTFETTHFSEYMVGYNKVSFSDVPSSAWYADAVTFIAARSITTGTGNGSFSPDAKLTRGDFVVMLMKAYGIAADTDVSNNFSDAGNTYYTGYLAAAKRLGISAGIGDNLFAPSKEITRQEMFTLLYNALKVIGRLQESNSGKALTTFSDAGQIASWATEAITFLAETGTISGNDGKISPTDLTTRAEMAQVLYKLLYK